MAAYYMNNLDIITNTAGGSDYSKSLEKSEVVSTVKLSLRGIEYYAAWFINRGIEEATKYENSDIKKELCYMNYAKLHKMLYYTIGITLADYGVNLLAKNESVRAHECGAIIHSIVQIARAFDFGLIKRRVDNEGIYVIPDTLVAVMESVYQELGRLDKRDVMRRCKQDGLWIKYMKEYDEICKNGDTSANPDKFPEMEADRIKEHFSKLSPNYFKLDDTLVKNENVIAFEVNGLDQKAFQVISESTLSQESKIISGLFQMRGYSNITKGGMDVYENRIGDVRSQLHEISNNRHLINLIEENYSISINPCVENLRRVHAGSCVEFALSRAKNNIDALIEAEAVPAN
jgi:uncharacterized phage-associated protein